jgi:ketosteroid isomerase-like protein
MTATNAGEDAVAIVERFFAALEAGDTDLLARLYTPDARIWHNDASGEQGVEDNLRVLRGLHAVVSGLHYDVGRRFPMDGGVVQQHVLRGTLPDGSAVAMPAAMFLYVEGGRVRRIEEYLDSAQAAPIRAARAALTAGQPG